MSDSHSSRRRGTAVWVLLGIGIVAAILLLYAGFGGPDEELEESEGIGARENVDAVLYPEGASPPIEDDTALNEADSIE